MDDLIARLEAATEGSRELDAEIFHAAYPDTVAFLDCRWDGRPFNNVPPYTTSLDAAETLWAFPDPLPKREPWRALQYWNDYRPGGRPYWKAKALECDGGRVVERAIGEHRIKIIAACIAALKARDGGTKGGTAEVSHG